MRAPEHDLRLVPLADWIPRLDASTVGRMAGPHAQRRALGLIQRVSDLRAVDGTLVEGRVLDGATSHLVTVGFGASGEVGSLCDCDSFADDPPCEHVAAILLALANAPEQRSLLTTASSADEQAPEPSEVRSARPRSPGSPPPTPRALPARAPVGIVARDRAIALARAFGVDLTPGRSPERSAPQLDRELAVWKRRGEIRPLGRTLFGIRPELAAGAGDDEFLPVATRLRLIVRVQPEAEKRPFAPDDLESRRLPAHEWRLLERLGRVSASSREFSAAGDAASVFLSRVHAAHAPLIDDRSGRTIEVIEPRLRPALRLRPATAAEREARARDSSEETESDHQSWKIRRAWLRYRSEQGPIDEDAFRELIGLPPSGDLRPAGLEERRPIPVLSVLEAVWHLDGDVPDPSGWNGTPIAGSDVFVGPEIWVLLHDEPSLARVADDVGLVGLARLRESPALLLDVPDLRGLPRFLRETFRSEGVILPSREDLGLPPLPEPHVLLRVEGSPFALEARLEARYGEATHPLGADDLASRDDPARNRDAEERALAMLESCRLSRRVPNRRGRAAREPDPAPVHSARGDDAVEFWIHDLPRLVQAAGPRGPIHDVVVPSEMRSLAVRTPVSARLEARSAGSRALRAHVDFSAAGVPADIEEIRRALAERRRWIRMTDGSVASLSANIAKIVGLIGDELGDPDAEVPVHRLGLIEAIGRLADRVDDDATVTRWRAGLRALESAAPVLEIEGLLAELRPYQRAGVAWLRWLAELGAGGILADDMGLGKTVQTLALLLHRRSVDGPAPSLVVAPTSVAPNWIHEATRFAPSLRSVLLHGADRHERHLEVPDADLVVTTYALLRRDVATLRGIRFRYVVLDEAQMVKNHGTATATAAKALSAEARLALTGTPIENRLLELWSILDFCNPGILGGWRRFAARYEKPILEPTAAGDAPAAAEAAAARMDATAALRARIRPFVLRRTKDQVERDLPPKIETSILVEPSPVQRKAYAALAAAAREDLGSRFAREGFEANRMRFLTALLRLRQMACDPRLVEPAAQPDDSAKLVALRDLLGEVIAAERRALVFSQFVELLALVRKDLEERGIEYSYLDGSTRQRQAVIDGFTAGKMPVFLLSLKAGGTGLNLAAADVVIHLDPWWNPAVEEQATDRAHRIGQTRTVSVYRLIVRGTIEEHIANLQSEKRAVADSIFSGDDFGTLRGVTEEDVAALLRFEL